MKNYPEWLHLLAWSYIVLCLCGAMWISVDILRGNKQKMWIMHIVWPVTALYFGPLAVWMYFRTRAVSRAGSAQPDEEVRRQMKASNPTAEQIMVAVFHCGAGCTVGDLMGEAGLFAIGGSVAAFVGGSEFGTKLLVDFVLAYVLGIFFQYFTIAPMRSLSFSKGIVAAMRADTMSISSFEVGMFAWMGFTRFVLFPEPGRIYPNMVVFWFMMQIAMMVGCATSFPANSWLLRKRWKETMPMYPSIRSMKHHRLGTNAA